MSKADDIDWAYTQARRAVRLLCLAYPVFDPDAEDLVQIAVLRAWQIAESGRRVSRRVMALCVRTAMSRLYGDRRYEGRARLREQTIRADDLVVVEQAGTSPALALSLWRLQRVWPDLTDIERAGLRCLLAGDSQTDAARRLGTTQPDIWRGGMRALELLREPQARRGNGALRAAAGGAR